MMIENNDMKISELFDELKEELTFLPDVDVVKEGYLFGFKYVLIS